MLTARQLEFAGKARLADKDGGPTELGFGGSRGGGKSFLTLAQVVIDDCQRMPGSKWLLLRKSGKSNRESVRDMRQKVLHHVSHTYSENRGEIRLPAGAYVKLGHFQNERDIDDYLGLEYDGIAVEEATTLAFRKYKDIKTCCRTSKRGWRPRIYTNANPGGVGHVWYKAKFIVPWKSKREIDTRFVPSLVTDNPHNNRDYVKVLDDLTGWQYKAWRYGDWDIAAGQFFSTFMSLPIALGGHIEEEFDDRLAVQWFAAMDYGFEHYTVVLLGCKDRDGRVHIVDEHAERRWLVPRHAEAIRAMLARHSLGLRDLAYFCAGNDIFGKESDGRTVAQDYDDHGIKLTPAVDDRVNGWAEVLRLLGDTSPTHAVPRRLFIHRRCARLIDTLPALEHNPNKPDDVLKVDVDEDGNGGDDAGDCARYLVATAPGGFRVGKFRGA